jgi:hypothetical protein
MRSLTAENAEDAEEFLSLKLNYLRVLGVLGGANAFFGIAGTWTNPDNFPCADPSGR